jgi:hypothetical protein
MPGERYKESQFKLKRAPITRGSFCLTVNLLITHYHLLTLVPHPHTSAHPTHASHTCTWNS